MATRYQLVNLICDEQMLSNFPWEANSLRDPNAHVEAVGQDEAHAATPMGQDIG